MHCAWASQCSKIEINNAIKDLHRSLICCLIELFCSKAKKNQVLSTFNKCRLLYQSLFEKLYFCSWGLNKQYKFASDFDLVSLELWCCCFNKTVEKIIVSKVVQNMPIFFPNWTMFYKFQITLLPFPQNNIAMPAV